MSLISAIESVLPKRRPIQHHEPCINGQEAAFIEQALKEGIAGNHFVQELATKVASQCGTTQAIITSSGTAALHVALLASGVRAGEEVLVPTLTFAGTAHAVSYCGATPNFVDGTVSVNAYKLRRYLERTTCPNPEKRGRLNCKTGRVISTLIVVDLLGFPADYTGGRVGGLTQVADEFGLTLIEDAAQALGASLGNRQCGSFGKAAILSFNNNKIVTGNGGGAVVTDDEWLAAKAYELANTARVQHPYRVEHTAIGYNYRMGNLNAALACAQMERLSKALAAKKRLLNRYKEAGLAPFVLEASEPWQGQPNYWLVTLWVDNRDDLLKELHAKGIYARALSTPLHQLPYYKDCPRDNLDYAEHTFSKAVCLPSGVGLCVD